ncbi:MAG: hypothetical protein ACI4HI_12555 [Lachnospiraceae bacterium]
MKIGEAKNVYRNQLLTFQKKKSELGKQRQALQEKMSVSEEARKHYENEAASVDLSYDAIAKQCDIYQDFMDRILEQHTAIFNMEAAKQQGEAMEEYGEDLAKILEVARRISGGDKVPAKDEKKLMEFSMELYLAAKEMASMNAQKKQKEYESLWDDDEEKEQPEDPGEIADEAELQVSGEVPGIVSVEDVML